jgi:hypothetical protein
MPVFSSLFSLSRVPEATARRTNRPEHCFIIVVVVIT